MLRTAILIASLGIFVYLALFVIDRTDLQKPHHKHHPGKCTPVKGHNLGSEDIATTSDGLAFVTSGMLCPPVLPGVLDYYKANNLKGRVYLFDFKQPEQGAEELTLTSTSSFNRDTFRPHGLAVYDNKNNGEILVYVVSHPDNSKDAIEKFRFDSKTRSLIHLRTIQDDVMVVVNDLVVTDEDQFYATNFFYYQALPLLLIENLVPLKKGNLFYYDGKSFKVVYDGIGAANGVTLSADKKFIYVAAYAEKTLLVLERNSNDNSVSLKQTVDLYLMPDNINLSQDGKALLIGGHPKMVAFLMYMSEPLVNTKSPSAVLHLPLKDGLVVTEEITELFYDHGDLISGSSSAANYGQNLLIGSVLSKLVYCPSGLDQ